MSCVNDMGAQSSTLLLTLPRETSMMTLAYIFVHIHLHVIIAVRSASRQERQDSIDRSSIIKPERCGGREAQLELQPSLWVQYMCCPPDDVWNYSIGLTSGCAACMTALLLPRRHHNGKNCRSLSNILQPHVSTPGCASFLLYASRLHDEQWGT